MKIAVSARCSSADNALRTPMIPPIWKTLSLLETWTTKWTNKTHPQQLFLKTLWTSMIYFLMRSRSLINQMSWWMNIKTKQTKSCRSTREVVPSTCSMLKIYSFTQFPRHSTTRSKRTSMSSLPSKRWSRKRVFLLRHLLDLFATVIMTMKTL